MKKFVILIVVTIAAFFLYKQFSSPQSTTTNVPANSTAAASVETAKSQAKANIQVAVKAEAKKAITAPSLSTPAAPGASVSIVSPANGSTVTSPVTIKFGVHNMTIAKAGNTTEFSGHHHLLIDVEELPDMTMPLPATDNIIHFGGGQTQTTIELSSGSHSLRLLLGNFAHVPHATPVLSEEIIITVSE